MAISSPLNPQTIVKERQSTMPAAMNFISGGSPMGSSIVSSAANKIIGFQRGASSVAPQTPDLGSVIKTLSSSILTNVENRVQSVNQNVNNIVNQTLKSYGQDYQNRLKQIDDAKPNSILSNFLKLYQQAIGYIQFLGNRKNVKTLGDNLQSLQRIFAETFDIAKIVRQTIVRIVKQLSNLPTASTGGGGINLDVNVPGGPLKRGIPKGLTRKMKMVGKGAAIAGGGALAVNALSSAFDGGDQVQPVATNSSEGLSGPILDRFNAILERFDAAISSMTRKSPASAPSSPTSSSGGESDKKDDSSSPKGGGGAGGSGANAVSGGTKTAEEMALVQTVMQQEGAGYTTVYGGKKVPQLTEMTLGEVYEASKLRGTDRLPSRLGGGVIPYAKDQYNSSATGAPQLMPDTLKGLLDSKKFNKDQKFSPEVQNEIILELARRRGIDPTKPLSKKDMELLGPEWASFTQYHGQSKNTAGSTLEVYNKNLEKIKKGGFVTPAKPSVVAATTPAATTQQIAQTVSQPAQQKPQVTVLPMSMDMGSNQTPPKQPSSGGSQPPDMTGGRMLQSFSSTNHDNFLTLYSKMVYNIVDG